ncbi:unnamed protein product [Rangifer tarandus platyrhynchus]|uniref:Uncharacterized protein n=1 Tax=Rangifer tarandus platyrhynchus TaxID=3082113 RepID=A0ABN8ZRA3_RANTA|nr:unnamed protein product [Rangifer tarandus platyrhynchus]
MANQVEAGQFAELYARPEECLLEPVKSSGQERRASANMATGLCLFGCTGPWRHRPRRSSTCTRSFRCAWTFQNQLKRFINLKVKLTQGPRNVHFHKRLKKLN